MGCKLECTLREASFASLILHQAESSVGGKGSSTSSPIVRAASAITWNLENSSTMTTGHGGCVMNMSRHDPGLWAVIFGGNERSGACR